MVFLATTDPLAFFQLIRGSLATRWLVEAELDEAELVGVRQIAQ